MDKAEMAEGEGMAEGEEVRFRSQLVGPRMDLLSASRTSGRIIQTTTKATRKDMTKDTKGTTTTEEEVSSDALRGPMETRARKRTRAAGTSSGEDAAAKSPAAKICLRKAVQVRMERLHISQEERERSPPNLRREESRGGESGDESAGSDDTVTGERRSTSDDARPSASTSKNARSKYLKEADESEEVAWMQSARWRRKGTKIEDRVREELELESTGETAARGLEFVQNIVRIARASKNLKGTTMKGIYEATHSLNSIISTLVRRATTSDSKRTLDDTVRAQRKQLAEMKRSNASLREEVDDLKRRLRGEMPPPRSSAASSKAGSGNSGLARDVASESESEPARRPARRYGASAGERDHLVKNSRAGTDDGTTGKAATERASDDLLERMTTMMRREIAALEDRLLPDRSRRPQVAVEKEAATAAKKIAETGKQPARTSEPVVVAEIEDGGGTWAQVVGRRAKKSMARREAEAARKDASTAGNAGNTVRTRERGERRTAALPAGTKQRPVPRKPEKIITPPRTAAVCLSAPE